MASEVVNHHLIFFGLGSAGYTAAIYETKANLNPLFIGASTDFMVVLDTKSYLDGLGR